MAIIGHVAIRLRLFPYEGMTVTDVIERADDALHRVKTCGKGNYFQSDFSVPEPPGVWVGAKANAYSVSVAYAQQLFAIGSSRLIATAQFLRVIDVSHPIAGARSLLPLSRPAF